MPVAIRPLEATDLLGVARELADRGRQVRTCRYRVLGELDERLRVQGPGRLVVELLAPTPGASPGEPWRAVRLQPGRRCTWCGPAVVPGGSAADVVTFVEDLLTRDEPDLRRRYRECG